MIKKYSIFTSFAIAGMILSACGSPAKTKKNPSEQINLTPADRFDLSHWKITLPVDEDGDRKVDGVSAENILTFSHPNFFYLDNAGGMVFVAPNNGALTENTNNTRSELRYMLRGENKKIRTSDAGNNFAIRGHKKANQFGAIGGRMDATLKVDHVARNTNEPNRKSAYSTVIGQIHAVKFKDSTKGLLYGNEPLKIIYKKWPDHDTGSVLWAYERNLAKEDPNRTDIVYPVWGNMRTNSESPGVDGVALGEEFSYTVNVHENTMYLTFESPSKPIAKFEINLADNICLLYTSPSPRD